MIFFLTQLVSTTASATRLDELALRESNNSVAAAAPKSLTAVGDAQ